MFDRPVSGVRALLIQLNSLAEDNDLHELNELVRSAGAEPVDTVVSSRQKPDAKFFVGTGKLEEIKTRIEVLSVEIVVVNHSLSPSQERNLEQACGVRVLDRNGLILDIFALRAHSFEGKLQVELAQLKHLSTRLIRGWTHLERQKGGIGMRGPGETQLETDRRLIGLRIKQIQKRLEKVEKQRLQGRNKRKKSEISSVSLVGYTNAGKSTLFNKLTESDIYAADQLFATLDPTLRSMSLDDGSNLVLADTVGFIRHLPHELVAAFKSTLQEASEADLLIHVVDASGQDRAETMCQVNSILQQIHADQIRQLVVFNKIDLLDGVEPRIDRNESEEPVSVWLSSLAEVGIDLLNQALSELTSSNKVRKKCYLLPDQGGIRSRLFESARIMEEDINESGGWNLSIEIEKKTWGC